MSTNLLRAGPLLVIISSCSATAPIASAPDTSASVETIAPDPGPPEPVGLATLEIADAPSATPDCASSTSPGADIDAARLYSDPTLTDVSAGLEACTLVGTPTCTGAKNGDPSAAEGASDSSGFDGFVSLNGRSLVCKWSQGERLVLGRVVEVLEVGADTAPEPFRVRACADEARESCGPFKDVGKLGQTLPAGQLLF